MQAFLKRLLLAAVAAGGVNHALAADMPEPVPEQAPEVVYQDASYGGWYIRGDIDYHDPKFRGADYITYGTPPSVESFDSGDLKGAFSAGAGVGYQMTEHFRADFTADYWFKSRFTGSTSCDDDCESTDTSKMSALLLLANAYVDLGTWHGVTPYLGAGIGGARVKWDDLTNEIDGFDQDHGGNTNWRFAYALMAGASYCLTDKLSLDGGYRFSRIHGGRMFDYNGEGDVIGAGPGDDKGFNTHEVRAGLRYQLGQGTNSCSTPVAYEPAPEPVYTK